jgi:hypothetical protein
MCRDRVTSEATELEHAAVLAALEHWRNRPAPDAVTDPLESFRRTRRQALLRTPESTDRRC